MQLFWRMKNAGHQHLFECQIIIFTSMVAEKHAFCFEDCSEIPAFWISSLRIDNIWMAGAEILVLWPTPFSNKEDLNPFRWLRSYKLFKCTPWIKAPCTFYFIFRVASRFGFCFGLGLSVCVSFCIGFGLCFAIYRRWKCSQFFCCSPSVSFSFRFDFLFRKTYYF